MDKTSIPLNDLAEEYMAVCRMEGKTLKTLRGYREKLFRFVRWYDGTLGGFNLSTVRAFIAELQDTKKFAGHPVTPTQGETLSAQTVKHFVMVLRGFATWLYEERYTPENVLESLKPPEVYKQVVHVLTDEEIEILLSCCDTSSFTGARNAAIVMVFLDTGLRSEELLSLRIGDVHLEDGWLKVVGKGQKERIIPFGYRTARSLRRYLNFRGKADDNDRLIVSAEGKPMAESALQSLFQRLRNETRIPRVHIQLLRHTFATRFLMAGNDSLKLQRLLGHESLEMTRRYVDMVAAKGMMPNGVVSPMDVPGMDRIEQPRKVPKPTARGADTGRRTVKGSG